MMVLFMFLQKYTNSSALMFRFLRAKTADEACVGRAFVAWDFGDGYEEDGVGGIDAIVR